MGVKWYSVLLFCCVVLGLAVLSLPRDRERGMLLNRGGRVAEAEPLLLEALLLNPDDRGVVLELLNLYRQSGTVEKALPILLRYQRTHPRDRKVRTALVQVCLQLYRFDQGIAVLEGAAEHEEDRTLLLTLYERAGYLEKAVALSRRELVDAADPYAVWARIARLQQWRFNVNGHAEALEAMLALRGKAEDGLALLELYLWRERFEEARRTVAVLAALDPLPLRALQVLRTFYLQERDIAAAIRMGIRVCSEEGAAAQDFLDLAALHLWSDDRAAALAAAAAGTARFPKNISLLRQCAFHAFHLKRLEARAEYERRIARLTGREEDWIRAALAQGEAGKPAEGRAWLEAHLQGQPRSAAGMAAMGRLAFMTGSKDEARRLAGNAAARLEEEGGGDPELLLSLAALFRDTGLTAEEAAQLERLSTQGADPDILLDLAAAYNRLVEFDKGLRALDRAAVRPGVDAVRLRRERAWLLLAKTGTAALGQPGSELTAALEATLDDTFDVELAQALVDRYGREGRLEEAVALMTKLPKAPAGTRLDVAGAFLKAGRKEEAARLLAQLGRPADLPFGELSRLAYLHGELGNHGLAIRLLSEADRRSRGNREIRRSLADAYGAAGDVKKQYAILDALAQNGGEIDWLAAADRRLWNDDRAAEAELLERAQKVFPESIPILARRITVYAALGEMEKALALRGRIRKVSETLPPDTLYLVAEMLASLKEYEEAADLYRRVLAAVPGHRDAHLGLARALAQGGRRRAALKSYRAYLALSPEDPYAWYELGEVKSVMGLRGAGEHRKALELLGDPTAAWQYAMAGRIHWRAGARRRALTLYRRAVRLYADDADLRSDLIDLYLEEELTEEAAALLAPLLKTEPNALRVRHQHARVVLQRQDLARALTILRRLHRDHPQDRGVLVDLAYAEDQARHTRRAMTLFAKALDAGEGRP